MVEMHIGDRFVKIVNIRGMIVTENGTSYTELEQVNGDPIMFICPNAITEEFLNDNGIVEKPPIVIGDIGPIPEELKSVGEYWSIKRIYDKYIAKKKLKWSAWKARYFYYTDPFYGEKRRLKFEYRCNGKRVQVRSGVLSAMASCNDEAGDKFDFKFGLGLAMKRLIIKKIASEVESKAK